LKNKILILGKLPQPVGGVTIHVSRLLKTLKNRGFNAFHFVDLREAFSGKIFLEIVRHRVIHLHVSTPYFQFFVAALCRVLRKRLIVTYHGNWGRFGIRKNMAVKLSSCLAFIPIVLNKESLNKAQKWNRNATIIPAFIPPVEVGLLSKKITGALTDLRSRYQYLLCTNASNLTFDKNDEEIYGISGLIDNISHTSCCALIISDPSGANKKYIEKKRKKMPDNILFIIEEHAFCNILSYSDAFIRNTTTDGDSVSIHEAIMYGVPVFASDCVSRPSQCRLFKDVKEMDFEREIKNQKLNNYSESASEHYIDTVNEIIMIYQKCLC